MNPLYFVDISEFSNFLSLQVAEKKFNYKMLKVLSNTVINNAELFQKAQGKEKEICQKKLKALICLLRERANRVPCNKESTKAHMIATAQLIDLK